MKFESKFGLGEIVYYTRRGHKKAKHDEFLEVVCINFALNDSCGYFCRFPNGNTVCFDESDLIGDPDFDQEVGYLYDITGEIITKNDPAPATVFKFWKLAGSQRRKIISDFDLLTEEELDLPDDSKYTRFFEAVKESDQVDLLVDKVSEAHSYNQPTE